MNISQEGIALIKRFEGCELEAYLDSVGIPTIAYGRIKNVEMGDTCTQEQAEKWLEEELPEYKVPAEIKRWNKAGGKVLQGLMRRREAEALLFENKEWFDV